MAEYNYDEESVNTLIEWAKSLKLPKQLQLSKSENICDVDRYVQANLRDIDAHYPDAFYNPSIDRLYRLKDKLEVN